MEWRHHQEATPGEREARIRLWSGMRRCGYARLEPQTVSAPLSAGRATSTHRGEPGVTRRFARHRAGHPVPRAASAYAPFLGRATRSERACPNREPGDDQSVRRPRVLCHLARSGEGVTLSGQLWDTLFSDKRASPAGDACASFPAWFSLLPFFCLFCSLSRWFSPLSRTHRLDLCAFPSPDQDELFHTPVVPLVGLTNHLK